MTAKIHYIDGHIVDGHHMAALQMDQREVPDRAPLELDKIIADPKAQPRKKLSQELIRDYADQMSGGAMFPPLIVFYDGQDFWLSDGFHRREAAKQNNETSFQCEILAGGLREAILHSCGANADHGRRRTNEDKRRAVKNFT